MGKIRIFHLTVIFTFAVFTCLLLMAIFVSYGRTYSGNTGLDMAKMQKMRTLKEPVD